MTQEQADKIVGVLEDIDIDINSADILDIESVDELETYLQDNGYLDKEIIYYDKAMEYLSENDNSLGESLRLASDMGYTLENLNSELLASLLASDNVMKDFSESRDEIEEILN